LPELDRQNDGPGIGQGNHADADSCHQKRTLVTSINIAENICAQVPHRQFVFTMPKRFRLYFRFNRELLRKLPRLAWETVMEVYRAVLDLSYVDTDEFLMAL
jgi:hypothetical protein